MASRRTCLAVEGNPFEHRFFCNSPACKLQKGPPGWQNKHLLATTWAHSSLNQSDARKMPPTHQSVNSYVVANTLDQQRQLGSYSVQDVVGP